MNLVLIFIYYIRSTFVQESEICCLILIMTCRVKISFPIAIFFFNLWNFLFTVPATNCQFFYFLFMKLFIYNPGNQLPVFLFCFNLSNFLFPVPATPVLVLPSSRTPSTRWRDIGKSLAENASKLILMSSGTGLGASCPPLPSKPKPLPTKSPGAPARPLRTRRWRTASRSPSLRRRAVLRRTLLPQRKKTMRRVSRQPTLISNFRHWYQTFRHWYQTFRHWYQTFRHWYQTFRHWYQTFRHWYQTFRHWYQTFRHWYQTFRHWYQTFRGRPKSMHMHLY